MLEPLSLVEPSQAWEARTRLKPSPIPRSCVHTLQEHVCGVEMEGKGQNVGDRWKEKDPEWQRRKKKSSKHMVAWPLASVLLPRDGGCECECVLV